MQVRVILMGDKYLTTAHRTCMARLGEVCSHVAAVLFLLEACPSPENNDRIACTDVLAQWPVPAAKL